MPDQKISADTLLTAALADIAADYFPLIDASEADATKNKRMLLAAAPDALADSSHIVTSPKTLRRHRISRLLRPSHLTLPTFMIRSGCTIPR